MKPTSFDHIVLNVENLERTVAFYSQVLGMEAREESPGKWSLYFGANKISLQTPASVPDIAKGTLPGTGNFCVLTKIPIAEVVASLERAGVEILVGPAEKDGATGKILSVYFNDPDGNLVEVSNRLRTNVDWEALEKRVSEEIEGLHRFFVGWFSGRLPRDCFQRDFLDRFDPRMLLIQPGGEMFVVDQFGGGVRSAHGSNPDFRIAIRNVKVQRRDGGVVLATYEEWQRNALASKPADNGRVASVWFRDVGVGGDGGTGLLWLHVHETWLPREVMEAGPFDF